MTNTTAHAARLTSALMTNHRCDAAAATAAAEGMGLHPALLAEVLDAIATHTAVAR